MKTAKSHLGFLLATLVLFSFSGCVVTNQVKADTLGPPHIINNGYSSSDVFVIYSPQNLSYNRNELLANFTVTAPTSIGDVGYSLDNGSIFRVTNLFKISEKPDQSAILPPYVDVTYEGTVPLSGLTDGNHTLTIYDGGQYLGNLQRYEISGFAIANFSIDTSTPLLSPLQIKNAYYSSNVPLNFTISEPASWIAYSLDNRANVTINGNTTLTGLTDGLHFLTVYANDTAGNMGASENITFSVKSPGPLEPFPTVVVAVLGAASAVLIAVGLWVYFKKFKRQ